MAQHDCRPCQVCDAEVIHGNVELTGTVLAADAVSGRASRVKGVRSIGDGRSLGHSLSLARC
jgi:hypothetical protein